MSSDSEFNGQQIALLERLYELNDTVYELTENKIVGEKQRYTRIRLIEIEIRLAKASMRTIERSSGCYLEDVTEKRQSTDHL